MPPPVRQRVRRGPKNGASPEESVVALNGYAAAREGKRQRFAAPAVALWLYPEAGTEFRGEGAGNSFARSGGREKRSHAQELAKNPRSKPVRAS
ncbi:hypothetical protein A7Q09_05415 [Methylacidiphilum sp. Yel]|nr:hypothetical protein A7Q09_05415 [Methylacidiphilum sp. Yel]